MSPSSQRILVVGASGVLGRQLVLALADRGVAVRALARDRARLEAALGGRAELAIGDATSADAIAAALEGCSGVHVCVAHGASEAEVVERVARGASRAGLRRISYVSGTTVREENAGAHPMIAGKLHAERLLRECGVPWTIFRPTWFMEALENFFKHGRAVCFGRGAMRLRFVASGDFAAMVARAYATDETANRAFRVLGPEPIALGDAIDRVRTALHPEIPRVTHLPFVVARMVAALRGEAGAQMRFASAFVRYFEQVEEGAPDPESERLLGAATTTLGAWCTARRGDAASVP